MPRRTSHAIRQRTVMPRGLREFVQLSVIAFHAGLIGEEVLLERLDFMFGGEDVEGSWSDENLDRLESEPAERERCMRSDGLASPPTLQFNLPKGEPLADWLFSSSDTDPEPCVPHGHWRSHLSQTKLDPYLGWIYHGSKQTEQRLGWADVNKLWRNPTFRTFARGCIAAALDDPRMGLRARLTKRRVTDPFRLPR
jgi:hypothetical protein